LLFLIDRLFPTVAFIWEDGGNLLTRVWSYLTFRFVDSANMKVSVARLVLGAAFLGLALFLLSKVSTLLDRRIAKRTNIDPGLRYTLARLLRYILTTVVILAVLKGAFDLDLTSLAIVFTALSVGIGFGLQYIAADIASGFILLFERPIRVGDRITIGEDEGDVQSIRLRTTIIYSNGRIAVIVPNSKLVSQRIINWSYGDPRSRIAVPIGVAYGSDVNLVTKTLLLAANDVEHVLSDPAPKVQLLRFGDFSLDFRLLVWTRLPSHRPQITSDINYQIEKLFRENGIKIPFPTQDLLLRGVKLPADADDFPSDNIAAKVDSGHTPED